MTLDVRSAKAQVAITDPTVLAAIMSGTSAAVLALITGRLPVLNVQ
ncbi:MAG: hypothetical protein WA996_23785 [Candidatus Promineifilaceae bacterium]